jgi:putative DNA primase/helicase
MLMVSVTHDDDQNNGTESALSLEHRKQFRESGLSDEQINYLIAKSCIRTFDNAEAVQAATGLTGIDSGLLFFLRNSSQEFYVRSVESECIKLYCQIKPDNPGKDDDGKIIGKYRTPSGAGNHAHFSVGYTYKKLNKIQRSSALCLADNSINGAVWESALSSRSVALFITEGYKKTECLGFNGYAAIGLNGVQCWKQRDLSTAKTVEDDAGNTTTQYESEVIPELDSLELTNRKVFVVFDSDVAVKESVKIATSMIGRWVITKEGRPIVIWLPSEPDDSKNGVDDFIARYGADTFDVIREVYDQRAEDYLSTSDLKVISKGFSFAMSTKGRSLSIDQQTKIIMAMAKRNWRSDGDNLYTWNRVSWELATDRFKLYVDSLSTVNSNSGWRRFSPTDMAVITRVAIGALPKLNTKVDRIAFLNGTFCLDDQTFVREHFKEDGLTYVAPFNYDKWADSPFFDGFLDLVTDSNEETKALLLAFMRFWIFPSDKDKPWAYARMLWLYGQSGTGKSTFVEILRGMVSRDSIGNVDYSRHDSAALGGLIGKSYSVDVEHDGFIANPEVLKSIVFNEATTGRKLHCDAVSKRWGVKFVVSSNNLPRSIRDMEGILRRLIVIPFVTPIEKKNYFASDVLKKELPGIFNRVLEMDADRAMELLNTAPSDLPATMQEIFEEVREAVAPVVGWLKQRYPDGFKDLAAFGLLQEYKAWLSIQGYNIDRLNPTSFAKLLFNQGCSKRRTMTGYQWSYQPKTVPAVPG